MSVYPDTLGPAGRTSKHIELRAEASTTVPVKPMIASQQLRLRVQTLASPKVITASDKAP